MDRSHLFRILAAQDAAALLSLLSLAYDEMNDDQRQAVFGIHVEAALPESAEAESPAYEVDGAILLEEIQLFGQQSLDGAYYAPFPMNSKNYRHIPDETKEWCRRMGDMLEDSCLLSAQGDHPHAVACFGILYQLIAAVDNGEEIVFAEEAGSWMIPSDERRNVAAYMTSLAATATPAEFTATALPLIRSDSRQSFYTEAYAAATRAATEAQRAHLDAELQRQQIPHGTRLLTSDSISLARTGRRHARRTRSSSDYRSFSL